MSLDRFSPGKNTLVSGAFELSGHHFLTLPSFHDSQRSGELLLPTGLNASQWYVNLNRFVRVFFFWQFTGALLYLFVQRGTPSQPLICKNLYYFFLLQLIYWRIILQSLKSITSFPELRGLSMSWSLVYSRSA